MSDMLALYGKWYDKQKHTTFSILPTQIHARLRLVY